MTVSFNRPAIHGISDSPRDRQQTAGEPGEIGQRHTAHAARIALEDARQGRPRMGSKSNGEQTLLMNQGK